MPEDVYEDLDLVIDFDGFDFVHYYNGEQDILIPRLAKLGFTHIRFSMGEFDSFGPLTRVCTCVDKDGNDRRFIYG